MLNLAIKGVHSYFAVNRSGTIGCKLRAWKSSRALTAFSMRSLTLYLGGVAVVLRVSVVNPMVG